MPKSIINFGSLNIDHVYRVLDFVQPGETLASHDYKKFVGGKGLNQSIALARAGADVFHVGFIGKEGALLKKTLKENNINVANVIETDAPSGHAIIQVNARGENCIILHGGANQCTDLDFLNSAMESSSQAGWLLLQNETNNIAEMIDYASERQMMIAFNPAPMSEQVLRYPLDKVDLLILNETEAAALTQKQGIDDILSCLRDRYPNIQVVLTLGENGSIYQDSKRTITTDSTRVEVVDTTAAGDTFIGYFITELSHGSAIEQCMEIASLAAAKCIQRAGASISIPYRSEIESVGE